MFFGCESNFQNIVDFQGSFTVYTSRRTRLILTFKSGLQLLPIGWQMYVRLHRHIEYGGDLLAGKLQVTIVCKCCLGKEDAVVAPRTDIVELE